MTKGIEELQSAAVSEPKLPTLSTADRAAGAAKGLAKRVIDVYFSAKCSLLRGLGIIDFPLPPNHILRRTSSHTIRHYYESGLTSFMPIATSAIAHGVDLDQPVNVLDFACGAGRQLLHLIRLFPNAHAYACDIRADAIAYLQGAYPKAKVYANKFDPPLNFPDATFDLIYSVSVFSHLSAQDARLWLDELRRVAKPGAVLCLTFNSYTSLARYHELGKLLDLTPAKLDEMRYFFDAEDEAGYALRMAREVALGFGHPGMLRPTGDMYYSRAQARSVFEESGFRVENVLPGVIDRFQDLAVLRRL
ncbi:MAG TPA: class I SAM-dependent methyltransferase [Terracidiphilus sp.]